MFLWFWSVLYEFYIIVTKIWCRFWINAVMCLTHPPTTILVKLIVLYNKVYDGTKKTQNSRRVLNKTHLYSTLSVSFQVTTKNERTKTKQKWIFCNFWLFQKRWEKNMFFRINIKSKRSSTNNKFKHFQKYALKTAFAKYYLCLNI